MSTKFDRLADRWKLMLVDILADKGEIVRTAHDEAPLGEGCIWLWAGKHAAEVAAARQAFDRRK